MHLITRQTFVKRLLNLGGVLVLTPSDFLRRGEAFSGGTGTAEPKDNSLMHSMVEANDRQIAFMIHHPYNAGMQIGRRATYDFARMAAAYTHPWSRFHLQQDLLERLGEISRYLKEVQNPDGTINAGNLESPPDTAFLLEPLCVGHALLANQTAMNSTNVLAGLEDFILRAAEALTNGGVHTPNHRWVVCAALARIYKRYPEARYIQRIEDWLGEGIDLDRDGHFSERSRNYSQVVVRSLITLERLLGYTNLLDPVRKHLQMTYYYMEPDGELVTTDSRRQDQFMRISILSYYRQYRYMAILEGDGEFASITRNMEKLEGFGRAVLDHDLVYFMEEPLLQRKLPDNSPVPLQYEKLFTTSHLLRIRRGATSLTLFGGVDWPLIIASGRSHSPDFFSYRKGEAILRHLRLSLGFFNTGYFYSNGLTRDGDGYLLHQRIRVPYYQPLPPEKRNDAGDYSLSPSVDGRFWNKMSFEDRPVSNVKEIETTIRLEESDGRADLMFVITGLEQVRVTLELCFESGGELSGLTGAGDGAGQFFLEEGMGRYTFGKDTLIFGPGSVAHRQLHRLEGERYSTHRGNLKSEGMLVYITGITPFEHILSFR